MFVVIILAFGIGFVLGYEKIMEYLEQNHVVVSEEIRKENTNWYNEVLDSLKRKTNQDKIKELEKQIEELKE